jgi:hypothetical protein
VVEGVPELGWTGGCTMGAGGGPFMGGGMVTGYGC